MSIDKAHLAVLAKSQCTTCHGGIEPLKGSAICELARQISDDWKVVDEHYLEKEFRVHSKKVGFGK